MENKFNFKKGKKYVTVIGFIGVIIYLLIEVVYKGGILVDELKNFIVPILILFLLNIKDDKKKPESAEKIIGASDIILFVIGVLNIFYIYGYIIGSIVGIFKN